MPLRAFRPCKQLGCLQLTRDISGFCVNHMGSAHEYDRRRGSAKQRGYDRHWKRLRKIFLHENPLCHDCLLVERLTPAKEVHHIKKVREHPELRLVKSNLMGLCKACHSVRTGRGE
ncbi:HNH endonuclease [Desulfosporosinus sp. Sb-LF]|uniref:HNH endonuclease n=1 Tax=Desulfosporosinus sp. Sb-LF TaxID=2560027 RepID=UPI00107F8A23|nr:HNH endonuclease [Desulfosporosinus sp. Sb-LF]TGE31319.1 HNH endonuclease [Desulfosporosinus sp. Sb-LF]